jgi:succinoglycan biosynthesis transport protein ExoP
MDLNQFVRMLRRHWLLILLSVILAAGAAALLAWTRTPIYAARAQLFMATRGVPGDLSQTYQGGLFSQQRVLSYAQIVSSPAVVQPVIEQLGLEQSVSEVQAKIDASVPTDTVLLDVTVKDPSPERAQAIVDAVVREFPKFVETLEKPQDGQNSPVRLSATSQAQLPTNPVSPRKPVYVAIGILLGLALGIAAAFLREALDKRIRDEGEVRVGRPVLGSIPTTREPKADHSP